MTILTPLVLILTGLGYFIYQTYHWAKKWKYQSRQVKKLKRGLTQLTNQPILDQRPLCFNWKDHLLMKIFGQKTWIRYRQGYIRARFAINYFYPTCWLSFFGLLNVLTKLLTKVFWQRPLNWFFWLNLVSLPILTLALFYQWKKLKKIPLNERSSRNE